MAVGAPVELDQLVEVGADHARVAVLTELRIAPLPGDVCGRFTEEWQVGVPGAPARGGQIDAVAAGGVGQRHEQVAVVDRVTKALGSVRPARRQVRQVGEAAVAVAPDLSLRLSRMERVGVGEADEEVERPGALAQEAHGAVGQVVGLTAV